MSCFHCKGGFGFGQLNLDSFRGISNFCSQRCLDDYRVELQRLVRTRRSLAWLQPGTNSASFRAVPVSSMPMSRG
jgi:hypothetical protein